MTVMRTAKTLFLSLLIFSGLVACKGVTPEVTSLNFGEIYIVGTYPGSTPMDNEGTTAQTITAVTFDDGSAFSLVTVLPFEMEQRTPYPLDFSLSPIPESFGELSDVAHLTIQPQAGPSYEVIAVSYGDLRAHEPEW